MGKLHKQLVGGDDEIKKILSSFETVLPYSPSPSQAIDYSGGLLDNLIPAGRSEEPKDYISTLLKSQNEPMSSEGNPSSITIPPKSLSLESLKPKKTLSVEQPTQPTSPIEPKPVEQKEDAYKSALDKYYDGLRENDLMRSIDKAKTLYTGQKLDEDKFKRADELAKEDVNKLDALRTKEKSDLELNKLKYEEEMKKSGDDPNSEISKSYRDTTKAYLKTSGADSSIIKDGMSANRIKELMGPFSKLVDSVMESKNFGLKLEQLKDARSTPKAIYDRLPEESKQTIEGLAKKNVTKTSIANQIDSVLSKTEGLDDDQKLQP